jgi:hypothetical protein
MTHIPEPRTFPEMELIYDQLAAAIDRAGPEEEVLFLTRLVMVMAHRSGPSADFAACIAVALGDSERPQVAGA